MFFVGIITWKGVSCFNGGGVFFRWGGGFIFKWEGMPHGDGISFDRGTSKKNCRVGGGDASL